MAAGIVMRLRSPPLCVAGEENDPEKAISELKKAAVFSKINDIILQLVELKGRGLMQELAQQAVICVV